MFNKVHSCQVDYPLSEKIICLAECPRCPPLFCVIPPRFKLTPGPVSKVKHALFIYYLARACMSPSPDPVEPVACLWVCPDMYSTLFVHVVEIAGAVRNSQR